MLNFACSYVRCLTARSVTTQLLIQFQGPRSNPVNILLDWKTFKWSKNRPQKVFGIVDAVVVVVVIVVAEVVVWVDATWVALVVAPAVVIVAVAWVAVIVVVEVVAVVFCCCCFRCCCSFCCYLQLTELLYPQKIRLS